MRYEEILGEKLKSEFLLDLFETYDVDVIYNYDRTHDNIEDQYYALIPEMGLEFRFDKDQSLTTIFMEHVEHTGYNPFAGKDPRDVPFTSSKEAVNFAQNNSIDYKHQEEKADSFFGNIPEWIKFNHESYSVHYQFKGAQINRVTLQIK